MNPNKTDKGLGTTPEKESTLASVTMENQQHSEPKPSQAAAPTQATSLEAASGAKGQTPPKAVTSTTILTGIEPQVPTTNPSFEQGAISSSESSEYEDDLPLPTFPYGPGETSLTHNVRPQTWTPQAMGKKEAEFPTTSLEQKGLSNFPDAQRKGDPNIAASAKGVDTKILPGISPIVKATVPDSTGKFPLTLNAPILQGVDTKALPGMNPIAEATVSDTAGKFQPKLNTSIPEGVDTNVLPGIDPIVKATVPDTIGKFQFSFNTAIPQQPVQSSAAEPFLFTREAKQPLKEAQFGPVKRRVVKPSRMEDNDDDAPKFPSMVFNLPESFAFTPQDKKPVEDSKFLPVKSSLAEAFTIAPQAATKHAEEQKVVPVKATLDRPSTPTNAPKKLIQEPQSIPVKSPVAKQSVSTQKARQSNVLPEFPATKLPVETEPMQPTAHNVRRPEGKVDNDKNAQVTRELLAENIELRSQRNALAMEKAALEAKLRGQAEEEEGRKALSARNDQQARELENLRAKLVKETEAKEKATSRANRLQKESNEQVDALREAGVEKAKLLKMVDNQRAELAEYKRQQTGLRAEADIGLANAAMEGDRARAEEENKRREGRVMGTLENLREEGKRRRQILMDELETKDAELHEAKREVRQLGRRLLASSQGTAEALVAASASNTSQPSPSPPPQTSIPTPPSSSTPSTPMPFSPRRLLILLFIFLLAFVIPPFHFNSLSQQATEEIEVWPTEVVGPRHQRIIQETQMLAMWEQIDPVKTAEEGWRRTREAARGYDEGF